MTKVPACERTPLEAARHDNDRREQCYGEDGLDGTRLSDTDRSVIPIQDELPSLVRLLREPAGADQRFATAESIRQNRSVFIGHVHATLKKIHKRSLEEILAIEGLLTPKSRRTLPAEFVWYLDRTVQLWRRINDAIVWLLLDFQDHVIRVVCHEKDRPRLSESNQVQMLKLLDDINDDPLTIAIWSDATTCVDVGDLVCRSFSGKLNGFVEVKEGVINEKILDLIDTKGAPEEIIQRIEEFANKYGTKAVKQLERVLRQTERQGQYQKIIRDDSGFDPRRSAEVVITDSKVPVESYDRKIQQIIDEATDGPRLRAIDACLWVYVDTEKTHSIDQKTAAFEVALTQACPRSMEWFRQQFGENERFEPDPIEGNLYCPQSIPLLLRAFEPNTIRDLLMGKLMYSVFLFLDWREFGRLIEDLGARLSWSSAKDGRRTLALPPAQRRATFGGRIPRIDLPDGRFIEGLSKVYRILFDGITPGSIAAQYVEQLKAGPPFTSEATDDSGMPKL